MRAFLSRFLPELTPVSKRERLRSAAGALVGILATGFVCRVSVPAEALPVLIAPMGASAVLLFAVPASPLAQPWSILGGNIVAALVGVTAAAWIGDPFVAASCAITLPVANSPAMMAMERALMRWVIYRCPWGRVSIGERSRTGSRPRSSSFVRRSCGVALLAVAAVLLRRFLGAGDNDVNAFFNSI